MDELSRVDHVVMVGIRRMVTQFHSFGGEANLLAPKTSSY